MTQTSIQRKRYWFASWMLKNVPGCLIYPVPRGEKRGLGKWSDDSAALSDSEIREHVKKDGNLGWRSWSVLVVDVDVHHSDDTIEKWENWQKKTGLEIAPSVETAGGGIHCYAILPDPGEGRKWKFPGKLRGFSEIDLLLGNKIAITPYSQIGERLYLGGTTGKAADGLDLTQLTVEDVKKLGGRTVSETGDDLPLKKYAEIETKFTPGNRNNDLNRRVYFAARNGDDDQIPKFREEAIRAGLSAQEADGTIKSALSAGMEHRKKYGSLGFELDLESTMARFLMIRQRDVLFIRDVQTAVVRTMVWIGDRWGSNEETVSLEFAKTSLQYCQAWIESHDLDQKAMREIVRWRDKFYNRSFRPKTEMFFTIYKRLRERGRIAEIETVDSKALNWNQDYLIFRNGGVNLRTDEMIPLADTKPFFSTVCLSYDFDPTAETETVRKLISGKERVMYYVALELTAGCSRNFNVVIGAHRTGKTTLADAIANSLEDYAWTSRLQWLCRDGSGGERGRIELHQILRAGVRIVMSNDAFESQRLDSGALKEHVGAAEISTRTHNRENERFTPRFSIFLMTNLHPKTGIFRDRAVADRYRPLPIDGTIEDDDLFDDADRRSLAKNDVRNRQAVMAEIVRRSRDRDWDRRGEITEAEIEEARREAQDEEMPAGFALFLEHFKVERDTDSRVLIPDIVKDMEEYRLLDKLSGRTKPTQKQLANQMRHGFENMGFETTTRTSGRKRAVIGMRYEKIPFETTF